MNSNPDESRQALILDFWFGDLKEGGVPPEHLSRMWWAKDENTDEYIRVNFEADLINAREGRLGVWEISPRGTLALIILLDQFSRNIYRGKPEAFAQDPRALNLSQRGIERGFDKELHPAMRVFIYMPFMHSEDPDIQKKSIALFAVLERDFTSLPALSNVLSENRDYADRHEAIIERFGRFPHRNSILGRESTAEEIEFLKQPGSSF